MAGSWWPGSREAAPIRVKTLSSRTSCWSGTTAMALRTTASAPEGQCPLISAARIGPVPSRSGRTARS
jgi:hypothetical protein